MGAIQKSLDEVRYNIPREVLEQTFIANNQKFRGLPVSLDHRIREEVVNPRVLMDCNLVGGVEDNIPLGSLTGERVDQFHIIYRIPKTLTQGRTIISPLSLTFGQGYAFQHPTVGVQKSSAMQDAAYGLLQAHLPIPPVSTGYVTLIGENTVLVQDNMAIPVNCYLRCLLSNDPEMNNINPASWHAFSQLVVLATKAYIYNNLSIPMDQAFLHGGMALGRLREIVDNYADANEMYYTHLNEVWRKTAFQNDPIRHRRHLKSILGGNW